MSPKIVSYALYPALFIAVAGAVAATLTFRWDQQAAFGLITVGIVITLMICERLFPLSRQWGMTAASFTRDIKYIALDAPVIALTRAAAGIIGIEYAKHHPGLLAGVPLAVGVVSFLLVFEFFQYWFHRLSHQGGGRPGRWLWKIHVAHHLPDRLYVLMHAVFHPINALISTVIIQATLIVLGVAPEAAFIALILIDLQALVSHFNLDLHAGPLNYILIGTETHRQHHSARPDSVNFGVALALWDLVFGTFYYRPGELPQKLGVDRPQDYPDSNELLRVLALPLRSVPMQSSASDSQLADG
jgi:sterol desaturase/sphingolipid hydroxylase (fatty acid hydroxylase superfamily)